MLAILRMLVCFASIPAAEKAGIHRVIVNHHDCYRSTHTSKPCARRGARGEGRFNNEPL